MDPSETNEYEDKRLRKALDPFFKYLSQAYAEESKEEATRPIVIISKETHIEENSYWAGWEIPALTSNEEVIKSGKTIQENLYQGTDRAKTPGLYTEDDGYYRSRHNRYQSVHKGLSDSALQ
ncbi:MAG: hypothetical protein M1835_005945 [Candelina submexicana]|nr:MAG: hypothetical protein M1835_005945 [Candelina submexicana]